MNLRYELNCYYDINVYRVSNTFTDLCHVLNISCDCHTEVLCSGGPVETSIPIGTNRSEKQLILLLNRRRLSPFRGLAPNVCSTHHGFSDDGW